MPNKIRFWVSSTGSAPVNNLDNRSSFSDIIISKRIANIGFLRKIICLPGKKQRKILIQGFVEYNFGMGNNNDLRIVSRSDFAKQYVYLLLA